MGIKTVPQPPYSLDLAPCNFWLFPKLRGCSYETIEEMKEAVMKVIDMLTQKDFHGTFQKLLGQYNTYIAAEGDYFEEDLSFMCVQSIKVAMCKKSLETYWMILVYISLCVYEWEITKPWEALSNHFWLVSSQDWEKASISHLKQNSFSNVSYMPLSINRNSSVIRTWIRIIIIFKR